MKEIDKDLDDGHASALLVDILWKILTIQIGLQNLRHPGGYGNRGVAGASLIRNFGAPIRDTITICGRK